MFEKKKKLPSGRVESETLIFRADLRNKTRNGKCCSHHVCKRNFQGFAYADIPPYVGNWMEIKTLHLYYSGI